MRLTAMFWVKLFFVIVFGVFLGWALATVAHMKVHGQSRPNVLFLLTDDLDWPTFQAALDAGLLPNIQSRMVTPGFVATRQFSVMSSCCPARAGLLSGQYPQNVGVWSNAPAVGLLAFDEAHALPTWLRASGYNTGHVGKYLNGYGSGATTLPASDRTSPKHVPPGWTIWQALDDNSTYTDNDHQWSNSFNGAPAYIQQDTAYEPDVVSARCLLSLQYFLGQSAPFYLECTPTTPHFHFTTRSSLIIVNTCPQGTGAPFNGGGSLWGITATEPPRYAGLVHLPIPMAPSFNEDASTLALKPPPLVGAPAMTADDIACAQLVFNRRVEQLMTMDDAIGAFLSTLDSSGKTGNTYVVLGSDNGHLLGDHRLIEKVWLYERAVRVPLVVMGPGVAPHTSTTLLTDRDFAPTVAALTGTTPLLAVDGRSWAAELTGGAPLVRYTLPLMSADTAPDGPAGYPAGGLLLPPGPSLAVRTATRKAIFYLNGGPGELYHLDTDPDELQNLYYDPAYAAEVADLASAAGAFVACHGVAACSAIETQVRP